MTRSHLFEYSHGVSVLHKMDARFKLSAVVLISATSMTTGMISQALLMGLVLAIFFQMRLSMRSIPGEFRYFILLIVFAAVLKIFTTPGGEQISLGMLKFSRNGLSAGGLVLGRLSVIVLTGMMLIRSTRSGEIKAGAEWFLSFVPWIPSKRIGVMFGLILRFIPVILHEMRECADAQRARCVESRKNPVYRLVKLGNPVMRRTFKKADNLVLAMEARCYTEKRTDPDLVSSPGDWLGLGIVFVLCGGLFIFNPN